VRGDGHAGGAFRLYGWRRVWNGKILRNPAVFYPLARFNCSVPERRGGWTVPHQRRLEGVVIDTSGGYANRP
jgi:hypothetical protein